MPVFKPNNKKWLKLLAFIFIFLNLISYFHAYKFTHFADKNLVKSKDAKKLSMGEKDETVNEGDIDLMFKNFSSNVKEVKKYPNASHESYLNQYRAEWTQHIVQFMEIAK
ncbi:MAG: hypothetical protein RIS64_2403 [Bacteroidota bacterium]|jgi:esterase/lipase